MFFWRLISTISLIIIFLFAFLLHTEVGLLIFWIAGIFLTIALVKEMGHFFSTVKLGIFPITTAVGACLFFTAIIFEKIFSFNTEISLIVVALFGAFCWIKILLLGIEEQVLGKMIGSAAVLILTVIPLNCIALIYMNGYYGSFIGAALAFYLILVTKAGDIGAYCIGTLTSKRKGGNHKIVPSVSPKKSWEGTIGGAIISIIVSYIVALCFGFDFNINFWFLFGILGIILFIGGFLGDLSESVFKRITDIKDSGKIIPGIGGVLDLVDSLIINAPFFYLFLKCTKII